MFREMAAEDSDRRWQLGAMERAGAAVGELDAQVRRGDHPDPPAMPDRELADGDLVDLPGRKLRVIWTPGHSPGHICLHLEDGDRIFTGDHVLPRITPHIGLYPYDLPDIDPLGDYLDSLGRVAEITAGEVLPAHQYRFNGLAERAGEIAAHHEERLTEITGLLSRDARTLWELTAAMIWRQSWDDMSVISRQMAAGEAAAHLRTLENRGLARRYGGGDPLRFVLS
jgi:glyoxylase-like metal-dependent hydrolase (beta-lactamase superfamily II)